MTVLVSPRYRGLPAFSAGVHRELVPLRALADWAHLVRGATTGLTEEQSLAVARLCNAAEARGENCSVWHQCSIFFGYPERCNCAPCRKARGAPAGAFRYHSVKA